MAQDVQGNVRGRCHSGISGSVPGNKELQEETLTEASSGCHGPACLRRLRNCKRDALPNGGNVPLLAPSTDLLALLQYRDRGGREPTIFRSSYPAAFIAR